MTEASELFGEGREVAPGKEILTHLIRDKKDGRLAWRCQVHHLSPEGFRIVLEGSGSTPELALKDARYRIVTRYLSLVARESLHSAL